MERLKFVALILIIPIFLFSSSCSPSSSRALDYELHPFTARFSLSMKDVSLSGTVTAGEFKENSPRDVIICFETPESLAGITVKRADGVLSLSLGELVLAPESPDLRWLCISDLFSLRGTVSSAKKATYGGTACTLVNVITKDGENYSVYIDKNGFPLCILGSLFGKDATLKIIYFNRM